MSNEYALSLITSVPAPEAAGVDVVVAPHLEPVANASEPIVSFEAPVAPEPEAPVAPEPEAPVAPEPEAPPPPTVFVTRECVAADLEKRAAAHELTAMRSNRSDLSLVVTELRQIAAAYRS